VGNQPNTLPGVSMQLLGYEESPVVTQFSAEYNNRQGFPSKLDTRRDRVANAAQRCSDSGNKNKGTTLSPENHCAASHARLRGVQYSVCIAALDHYTYYWNL
jgi:hypothetical protein